MQAMFFSRCKLVCLLKSHNIFVLRFLRKWKKRELFVCGTKFMYSSSQNAHQTASNHWWFIYNYEQKCGKEELPFEWCVPLSNNQSMSVMKLKIVWIYDNFKNTQNILDFIIFDFSKYWWKYSLTIYSKRMKQIIH